LRLSLQRDPDRRRGNKQRESERLHTNLLWGNIA
jgi:hypothetical protein